MQPKIIQGGTFSDYRGIVRFVNDFHFDEVVRFYCIKHPDTSVIRAWQAHQFENKYFYPISGAFVIAWVEINSFENPSPDLISNFHIINSNKSELVYIPKGFANGIKALKPNSEMIVFSNLTLEKSLKDNRRYDSNMWFDWKNLKSLNIKK